MPKRLTPSEITQLIDSQLRALNPATAEFSPSRQGELKFREYTISDKTVLVSTPAHDQETETNRRDEFKEIYKTAGTSALKSVKDQAVENHQGKTVFIPLAECRNGRQHWALLVREANGNWHFYDPKAAGWSCGLFSCLSHQLYDTSHLESMLGTNDINFHYTGIQNLFNSQICGYVVTHLITCLAQGQDLAAAKKSFEIADYLPETSTATEADALLYSPQGGYGTAVAAVADDDGYAAVNSAGGLNDDEPKKKSYCTIM